MGSSSSSWKRLRLLLLSEAAKDRLFVVLEEAAARRRDSGRVGPLTWLLERLVLGQLLLLLQPVQALRVVRWRMLGR